jgi:hypothetical protein
MNSLPSSVERENLGQFLLENLQDITDKLDQIVTDSERIILDNLLQETKILLEQVKDNSKTYQARADIFCQIDELWFQVWEQYKNEGSAINLIEIINEFTDRVTAYAKLFIGLAQINEGKTGEEKADLIRVVEGSLLLSETIDVFIDMFADSELEQIYQGAKNALSVSNRTITEYFQDTDKSLVTQLRAYYSLIIFRIKERFNPSNVSSENTSHSLTDDLSDLDPWTRDLVGVIDVFIDMFADSELEQIYQGAKNALSVSNRTITEYFQDTDKSLVTQLRAYYSLIIFRIQERFNPKNVSSETTSHSLTDDLSDLDPWTRNLVGVVDLETEKSSSENWLDNLSGSISDQEVFEKALEYGRVFRQNVSSETTSHSLTDDLSDLDPWTRNLVGVVDLGSEDPKESYIDYLVEKYR